MKFLFIALTLSFAALSSEAGSVGQCPPYALLAAPLTEAGYVLLGSGTSGNGHKTEFWVHPISGEWAAILKDVKIREMICSRRADHGTDWMPLPAASGE